MKRNIKCIGIITLVAAIGFAMAACSNSTGGTGGGWTPEYAVGDPGPAGGTIFYVADGQEDRPLGFTVQGYTGTGGFSSYKAYYLEVWTSNEANSEWGDYGTLVAGITTFDNTNYDNVNHVSTDPKAFIIGNGRKDTQIIVVHMEGKSITNTAAQRCASATYGTRNDWFLPSLGELNELYKAKGQPNVPTTSYFWSSSQYSKDYTWYLNFANGRQQHYAKDFAYEFRAIRAF